MKFQNIFLKNFHLLKLLSNILNLLEKYGEKNLAYRYTYIGSTSSAIKDKQIFLSGPIFGAIRFAVYLLTRVSILQKISTQNQLFSFFNSYNQFSSFEKIYTELIRLNNLTVTTDMRKKYLPCSKITFTLNDIVLIVMIIFKRRAELSKMLRIKHISKTFFPEILKIYSYLVFFTKSIKANDYKLILINNDHLPSHRVLLYLSKSFKIKTVLMQHASVTDIFPPLETDYAFLDGAKSKEIYEKCSENLKIPKTNKCKVFLCGSLRHIPKVKVVNFETILIGYNPSDSFEKLKELIFNIYYNTKYRVVIRFHPSIHNAREIIGFFRHMSERIKFSNVHEEELCNFFFRGFVLIAGNSSILRESSIAGLKSIWYPLDIKNVNDYYGFVKCKIANESHQQNIIEKIQANFVPCKKSLQSFCSTYGTDCYGQEYELCLSKIREIISGRY